MHSQEKVALPSQFPASLPQNESEFWISIFLYPHFAFALWKKSKSKSSTWQPWSSSVSQNCEGKIVIFMIPTFLSWGSHSMCGASALFCVFVFVTTLFVSFLNKHDYRKLKLLLNTGTISLCTSISMTWYNKNLQDLNTRNISENCFQFLSKIANCLSINCWLHSVEPNYTILNIPQFVIPQSPALPGAVQKTRDGPSSMEVGLTKSQHLNHPGSAMQKFSMESWCPPDLWSISHFWLQTGFSRFMA